MNADAANQAISKAIQSGSDRTAAVPGARIIAEFDCGADARAFCRIKGAAYTICLGVNRLFAVMVLS